MALVEDSDDVTFESCAFTAATGGRGGALRAIASDLKVVSSTFDGCSAEVGARVLKGSKKLLRRCAGATPGHHQPPSPDQFGGAIYAGTAGGSLMVDGVTASSCSAVVSGGAIFVDAGYVLWVAGADR